MSCCSTLQERLSTGSLEWRDVIGAETLSGSTRCDKIFCASSFRLTLTTNRMPEEVRVDGIELATDGIEIGRKKSVLCRDVVQACS